MPKAYFSGDALTIHVSAGVSAIDTQADLYSDWKDWKQTGDNTKFPPAFTTIGGDDLGGGLEAGDYYFLNTSAGWALETWDGDHDLLITGNLYPDVAGNPLTNTITGRTVGYYFERSQLTQGVTGLSDLQDERLEEIWTIQGLDNTVPVSVATSSIRAGASIVVSISGSPTTKVVKKRA